MVVRYSWRRLSRESHAQDVVLLWVMCGSSRESHAIVLQHPTTKRAFWAKPKR